MKIALLRVAVDSGSGGMQGPLFADGTFEYVPIPDEYGVDARTYGNTLGARGRPLVDYFPAARQPRIAQRSLHFDPEFTTFTYGDPTPPKAGLRHLVRGDLLVFYCGLEGFDCDSPPALYLLGYFEVEKAGYATDFTPDEIESVLSRNWHVMNRASVPHEWPRLVLVKGGPNSRMYERAAQISAMGRNRRGQPLKILAPELHSVFGDFDGHVSIQRSPPRWVREPFIDGAAAFIRAQA
jgi:hypothetical protein